MKKKELINFTNFEKSYLLLLALAHPMRISILNVISQNQPISVKRIYKILNFEQSITSQHLKVLRDSELVHNTRSGKEIYYEINFEKNKNVAKALLKLDLN